MRIGELARRSGVSEKTLRYYEDIGLIDKPPRTQNGYRDYAGDVVDRLRFVRSSQAIGLTLAEIREVIGLRDRGETPCAHVVDLLRRHTDEIDTKIAELERLRAELVRLERRSRSLDPKDCRPDKVCHVIEPAHASR